MARELTVAGRHGRQQNRRPVCRAVAPLLLIALSMLSSCGTSGGASTANTISMGVADFQQHALTIRAGDSVHFVNPANGGGTHALCIGKDGQCIPQPGAPMRLNTGTPVLTNQGDAFDVVFASAGTFQVVCTVHPAMQVTIVVQ